VHHTGSGLRIPLIAVALSALLLLLALQLH
jgi:hypothetical protein